MRPPQVGRTTILACLLEAAMELGKGCVAPWSGWKGWRARSAAGPPLTLKGVAVRHGRAAGRALDCPRGVGACGLRHCCTPQHWWAVDPFLPLVHIPAEAAGLLLLIATVVGTAGTIAAKLQGGSKWATSAAGLVLAVPTFMASMIVQQATCKPALQALAAAVMLPSGLAATFMWAFAAVFSALAAVPLLLAGKRRA